VLKWARENECPWDKETCKSAAEKGNLEMLQWAYEHGCPWEEGTCSAAASCGNLVLLKWARKNRCPWDEGTCRWKLQTAICEFLLGLKETVALGMSRHVQLQLVVAI
jgi:hypothetical protein